MTASCELLFLSVRQFWILWLLRHLRVRLASSCLLPPASLFLAQHINVSKERDHLPWPNLRNNIFPCLRGIFLWGFYSLLSELLIFIAHLWLLSDCGFLKRLQGLLKPKGNLISKCMNNWINKVFFFFAFLRVMEEVFKRYTLIRLTIMFTFIFSFFWEFVEPDSILSHVILYATSHLHESLSCHLLSWIIFPTSHSHFFISCYFLIQNWVFPMPRLSLSWNVGMNSMWTVY